MIIQIEGVLNHLFIQVFSQICNSSDQPMMDLFATKLNHKLPRYICPTLSDLDSDTARSHPREFKCSNTFHVPER